MGHLERKKKIWWHNLYFCVCAGTMLLGRVLCSRHVCVNVSHPISIFCPIYGSAKTGGSDTLLPADDSLAAWSMLILQWHLSPSALWDPSSCPETDVWTALTLSFWDQFGSLSSINIRLRRCKNIPDYLRARRSLFLFFPPSFLQSVSFHILIQVCKVNKQALKCWAPPCCS